MPQVAQPWMPGAQKIDRGGGTPVQWDGPTVVVLHTTESSGPASYAGTEPHFEVYDGAEAPKQFIGLNNTAKALYNEGGGVETNRRRGRIIQIEIVARATNAPAMPVTLLRKVARVIAFVKTQFLDLQLVGAPQGFHGDDEGVTLASASSKYRFSFAAWEAFGGICAHQHVPENDHWDTGRIDIARLIALTHEALGTSPTPAPSEEDAVFSKSPVPAVHLVAMHSSLLLTAEPKKHGAITQQLADGTLNQRWMLWGHQDGTVSFVCRTGDLAIDVPDNIGRAGVLLQVYPFDGNPAQRFWIETVAGNVGRIHHQSGVVLDVFGGVTSVAGARLGLYTPHRDPNQQFLGVPTV